MLNLINMYIGDKHQDAEIIIDLDDGEIHMNYSSKSNYYNSNDMRYDIKLKTNKIFGFLYYIFLTIPLIFARDILFEFNKIPLKLFPKIYKKYKLQYIYQKSLKHLAYCLDGIVTETIEGEQSSTILTIPLRANLYVEYNLTEDYQTYIKKISLKRSIVQIENPIEIRTQQIGWKLILEFTKPPKQGSAIIKYIY